jgi:hypothetical protein
VWVWQWFINTYHQRQIEFCWWPVKSKNKVRQVLIDLDCGDWQQNRHLKSLGGIRHTPKKPPLKVINTACEGGVGLLWRGFVFDYCICPLIKVISGFGFFQGFVFEKDNRNDDKTDATQLTSVFVKLKNIGFVISVNLVCYGGMSKMSERHHSFRWWKWIQQVKVLNKTVFKDGVSLNKGKTVFQVMGHLVVLEHSFLMSCL